MFHVKPSGRGFSDPRMPELREVVPTGLVYARPTGPPAWPARSRGPSGPGATPGPRGSCRPPSPKADRPPLKKSAAPVAGRRPWNPTVPERTASESNTLTQPRPKPLGATALGFPESPIHRPPLSGTNRNSCDIPNQQPSNIVNGNRLYPSMFHVKHGGLDARGGTRELWGDLSRRSAARTGAPAASLLR